MASDAEIDQTLERGQRVEDMWKEIEQKLEQYEQDKSEFAREFGVDYEQYLEYMTKKAAEARGSASQKTLDEIEKQSAEIQKQFDEELAQAEARLTLDHQLSKTSKSKRPRGMRDMI